MKRNLLRALLVGVLIASTGGMVHAKSWRINSNAAKAPHFADINAACASDEVQDGDVLYIDPGTYITTEQTVTKQLTIIGPGYLLAGLPYQSASIGALLNLNSDNCKVIGLKLAAINNDKDGGYADLVIGGNGITIERCQVSTVRLAGANNNTTIKECFVRNGITGRYGNSNTHILNNIIIGGYQGNGTIYSTIEGLTGAVIRCNTIVRSNNFATSIFKDLTNATITDNILLDISKTKILAGTNTNCQITNNVVSCDAATLSAYPNNRCLDTDDVTTVIVGNISQITEVGSSDALFQLCEVSPAKDYPEEGDECGAFGGMYPYVLSGLPQGVPYFVSSNNPTRVRDGQVKLTQTVRMQTK